MVPFDRDDTKKPADQRPTGCVVEHSGIEPLTSTLPV